MFASWPLKQMQLHMSALPLHLAVQLDFFYTSRSRVAESEPEKGCQMAGISLASPVWPVFYCQVSRGK